MSQLTKQDVIEAVEEALDRKLDEKLDKKLDEKLGQKLDEKLGAFVEHLDDKFDSLAEAISLINTNMQGLAKASELQVVKDDVVTIKFAVKETNKDLHKLEGRFDNLEGRFDNLEGRFDNLEDRFDRFERAYI